MKRETTSRELFDKVISTRVTTPFFNKLEDLRKKTNCRNLGEFTRKILLKEKINFYHKDATMESVATELAAIRKELRAIGININQATHYLHGSDVPAQKLQHAANIANEYKKVSGKVEQVLALIANVSKKWSSKS
jgi:hypothetical protein